MTVDDLRKLLEDVSRYGWGNATLIFVPPDDPNRGDMESGYWEPSLKDNTVKIYL